jgi:hypothetical protein
MLLNQSSVFSMQQGAFFHRNYLLASTGITRWFHRNLKAGGLPALRGAPKFEPQGNFPNGS